MTTTTKGKLIDDLDLAPRGVEVIDLRGRLTRKQGHDFYTEAHKYRLYGPDREPWSPAVPVMMGELRAATEKRLQRATKAELIEFLNAGYSANNFPTRYLADMTKASLVTRAIIACSEAWFPAVYVNEPAEKLECRGHESTVGPAGVSTYCDGGCRS